MQRRDVRRVVIAGALALAVPGPLTGCGMLGSGPAPAGSAPAAAGDSWVVVATGNPTPSATTGRGATASPSPSSSHPPYDPSCDQERPTGEVLIPLTVLSGSARFTVTWPQSGGGAGYRVAAVPQRLDRGEQPAVRWKQVTPGTGCSVSATITGLVSDAPYVVWLDAPGAGHLPDGTRRTRSGRSGIVYPR